MNNTIPLKPLGDRLVVVLEAKLEQSAGGIAIPDRAQDVPSWGSVASHGPDAQHVIPGDRVYVPTHLGTSYVSNGVNIIIIEESKILAREERVYKVAPEVAEQACCAKSEPCDSHKESNIVEFSSKA